MLDSPLHCPQPQPIETTLDILNDLTPLLEHLATNPHVTEQTTFPVGTLMPDGRLDMCKQNLGVRGCELVAQALESNTTIEALLLNVNHLGERGVEVLAEALATNTTLTELGLASNGISDRGCQILMSAIENMPSLTRLDLGYSPSTKVLGVNPNAITDRGINAIASYLSTNLTLSHLNLGRVKLEDRSQSLLFDAFANNRTLTHLFVSGKLNPEITSLLAANRSIDTITNNYLIRSVYR